MEAAAPAGEHKLVQFGLNWFKSGGDYLHDLLFGAANGFAAEEHGV